MKMGGGPKPFGIDAGQVPALAREVEAGCEWRGLHIFTGSQALSAEAVIDMQAKVLELAARITDAGVGLPKLNMGGGFGIPYFAGDELLDIVAVGAALEERFSALPASLRDTEFFLELGRHLAGEVVYLTRIVDRKESYGETYLVIDGGLHHRSGIGQFRHGRTAELSRRHRHAVRCGAAEEANVVGRLCTPLDRLADKAHPPPRSATSSPSSAPEPMARAHPPAPSRSGPASEILV